MNDLTQTKNTNLPATVFTPSELLGMFASYLSQQDVNRQLIYLRGMYLKNPKHNPNWSSRYDILRDENTQTEITLQIPYQIADTLKDGNLVTFGGVLGRRVQNNGNIQITLQHSYTDRMWTDSCGNLYYQTYYMRSHVIHL